MQVIDMATQDEKTQIAVLQSQMVNMNAAVKEGFDGVNKRLDVQESKYVLVAVYEPRMLALETKVNAAMAKRWVQNTLSGVLGALLTALIGYFILNIGR